MTKTFGYVSLIRANRDNPVWEDTAGELTVIAGKVPETYIPRVYNEETDRIEGYSYDRVELAELPECMQAEDAFDYVRTAQPGAFAEFYLEAKEVKA